MPPNPWESTDTDADKPIEIAERIEQTRGFALTYWLAYGRRNQPACCRRRRLQSVCAGTLWAGVGY